jgi:hypothetical protein
VLNTLKASPYKLLYMMTGVSKQKRARRKGTNYLIAATQQSNC